MASHRSMELECFRSQMMAATCIALVVVGFGTASLVSSNVAFAQAGQVTKAPSENGTATEIPSITSTTQKQAGNGPSAEAAKQADGTSPQKDDKWTFWTLVNHIKDLLALAGGVLGGIAFFESRRRYARDELRQARKELKDARDELRQAYEDMIKKEKFVQIKLDIINDYNSNYVLFDTQVENRNEAAKKITNSLLLIGPEAEKPGKIARLVTEGSSSMEDINFLDSLKRAILEKATYVKGGRALIPLPIYYEQNINIFDESVTYQVPVHKSNFDSDVPYAVRFVIFGEELPYRVTAKTFVLGRADRSLDRKEQ
jgi:hypothetical protein